MKTYLKQTMKNVPHCYHMAQQMCHRALGVSLSAGFLMLVPYMADAQQLFTSNDQLSTSQLSQPRTLNYYPDGQAFVTINGSNRFTRALYGGNTGFRLETSDYPEFALYMPRMGGNIEMQVVRLDKQGKVIETVSLKNVSDMECRYQPGERIYQFTVPSMQKKAAESKSSSQAQMPTVTLTAMAMYAYDAAIWQIETQDFPADAYLQIRYGGATNARFSREGDMGVDKKDCFDFKPSNCADNEYQLQDSHSFKLHYGKSNKKFGEQTMLGYFSPGSRLELSLADKTHGGATAAKSGAVSQAGQYLLAYMPLSDKKKKSAVKTQYFMLGNEKSLQNDSMAVGTHSIDDRQLSDLFTGTLQTAKAVASTIKIETPDPFFNTLGGAMSMAADAIWGSEEECWLHGSIGWRMALLGWRAAYTGDVMGWHDRARTHFDNYARSQVTDLEPTMQQPAQDAEKNLARGIEKWGTPMYSTGYIGRFPNNSKKLHHYDMNLVYIDELLWHFNWTGDWSYVLEKWPVLARHLAWEKRNFDANDDGLYDAYCCIWASDGLYYSGGAATHSTAYNYRANKMAAMMARHFAADATMRQTPVSSEIQQVMPVPATVTYTNQAELFAAAADYYEAESKKTLAAINKRLWMGDKGVWAECQDLLGLQLQHTHPALWTIYHSIDSDIADAMQAYSATQYVDVEIPHIPVKASMPQAIHNDKYAQAVAAIQASDYATISTSNWQPYGWSINNVAMAEVTHTALAYWQAGRNESAYKLLKSAMLDAMYLGASPGNFGQISYYDAARSECYRDFGDPVGITTRTIVQGLFGIRPDRLNNRLYIVPGFPASWDHASIATPDYELSYQLQGADGQNEGTKSVSEDAKSKGKKKISTYTYYSKANFATDTVIFRIQAQSAGIQTVKLNGKNLTDKMGQISYLADAVECPKLEIQVCMPKNNRCELQIVWGEEAINTQLAETSTLSADGNFKLCRQGDMQWWQPMQRSREEFTMGSLTMTYFENVDSTRLEMVNMDASLNDSVTALFAHDYLTPRSPYTTLSLPKQGIGEWCHPLDSFSIDDSYIRMCGERFGYLPTSLHVPFRTSAHGNNILFTSRWDNFPNSNEVPLTGKASHIYLMMAGTTNAMQSRMTNGIVRICYADGSADSLLLINPETWWPIEQDYMAGTPAFYLQAPQPYRQTLANGGKGTYRPKCEKLNATVKGGAATLLDLPIDADKELKSLELETLTNDVVIGLMGITLQR